MKPHWRRDANVLVGDKHWFFLASATQSISSFEKTKLEGFPSGCEEKVKLSVDIQSIGGQLNGHRT